MVAEALGAEMGGTASGIKNGIDISKIAERLSTHHLQSDIPELIQEEVEANQYVPLGSPVAVLNLDPDFRKYSTSKKLYEQGLSLDQVVGYVISRRIPKSIEEVGSQDVGGPKQLLIIRYYGKKKG